MDKFHSPINLHLLFLLLIIAVDPLKAQDDHQHQCGCGEQQSTEQIYHNPSSIVGEEVKEEIEAQNIISNQNVQAVAAEINTANQNINSINSEECFRAAVLEYNRVDLNECRASAEGNLEFFESSAKLAALNGAKMIVFPEDGIFIGTREYIDPCLEDVPDPKAFDDPHNQYHTKTPCLEPDMFASAPILVRLSCIAREHSLYVVANYGTRQNCEANKKIGDTVCSAAGFLRLNTNVVLDPTGKFIARYRKYNPFIEVFQKAPELEHAYFDTPFGRFGIMTCFDMIYRLPAIDLVEKYHIDTMVYPTWWFDELPILSGLQYQEAWSWGNKVNLLASNIQRPSLGSTGSGIFSGSNLHYMGAMTSGAKSRLLVANVAVDPNNGSCQDGFKPLTFDLHDERQQETGAYRYKNYTLLESDSIGSFTKLADRMTICSGRVCCTIDYRIHPQITGDDSEKSVQRLALIVRDSHRPGSFRWAEQTCALATLEQDSYKAVRGARRERRLSFDMGAAVRFEKLSMNATFNTHYVYPFGGHNASRLVDRNDRQFNCDRDTQDSGIKYRCRIGLNGHRTNGAQPIYSFGMYARPYDEDPPTPHSPVSATG